MQTTVFLSVISGAVVAAALSSAAVQLQPTSVVVARPASSVQAAPALASAVLAVTPELARPAQPVAAPARPAYVQVDAAAQELTLSAPVSGAQPTTVDVLACTQAWSAAGECLGQQASVLRDVVIETVARAVRLPAATPHVRVSVHGGEVSVGALPVRP